MGDVQDVLAAATATSKPEPLKSGYALHETGVQLNPSARCTDQDCDWPEVIEKAHAKASGTAHAQLTGHAVVVDNIMRTVVEVKPR